MPNAYKYAWNNTINGITTSGIGTLQGILAKNSADITQDDAGQFASIVAGWNSSINGNNGTGGLEAIKGLGGSDALTGTFGAYINKLLDLPDVTFPNKDDSIFRDQVMLIIRGDKYIQLQQVTALLILKVKLTVRLLTATVKHLLWQRFQNISVILLMIVWLRMMKPILQQQSLQN